MFVIVLEFVELKIDNLFRHISDSFLSLRIGHRNPKSLTLYQHLRGEGGRNQQADNSYHD